MSISKYNFDIENEEYDSSNSSNALPGDNNLSNGKRKMNTKSDEEIDQRNVSGNLTKKQRTKPMIIPPTADPSRSNTSRSSTTEEEQCIDVLATVATIEAEEKDKDGIDIKEPDSIPVFAEGQRSDKYFHVQYGGSLLKYAVVDNEMQKSGLWKKLVGLHTVDYSKGFVKSKNDMDPAIIEFVLKLIHGIKIPLPDNRVTLVQIIKIAGWMVVPTLFTKFADDLKKDDTPPTLPVYREFMKQCFYIRNNKNSIQSKQMLTELMRSTTANALRYDIINGKMSRDLANFVFKISNEIRKSMFMSNHNFKVNIGRFREVVADSLDVKDAHQCVRQCYGAYAKPLVKNKTQLTDLVSRIMDDAINTTSSHVDTRVSGCDSISSNSSPDEVIGPTTSRTSTYTDSFRQMTVNLKRDDISCDDIPTLLKLKRSTSTPSTRKEVVEIAKTDKHPSRMKGSKRMMIKTTDVCRCPNNDSFGHNISGKPCVPKARHFHLCMICSKGLHGPKPPTLTKGTQCMEHIWVCNGDWMMCKGNHAGHRPGCNFNISTMYQLTAGRPDNLLSSTSHTHSHWDDRKSAEYYMTKQINSFARIYRDTLNIQKEQVFKDYTQ
jgi:hypothetical protein